MTREEAVIILDGFKNNPLFSDTHVQALDMAISALSTEGEYIKKSELLQHVTTEELSDFKDCDVIHAEEIDKLTTYSFSNSAENKGEWIDISTGKGIFKDRMVKCSVCGNTLNLDGVNCGRGDANYCPNCGADMRGEADERS